MANPVNEKGSVNKRYLESQLFDYVKRNGAEPMTFNLDMANYRVVNTGDPQDEKDAANKKYVDNASFVKTDGSTPWPATWTWEHTKLKIWVPPQHMKTMQLSVLGFSILNSMHLTTISQPNLRPHIKNTWKNPTSPPLEHRGENAFRYLMEDADESSSENNISVTGIVPSPNRQKHLQAGPRERLRHRLQSWFSPDWVLHIRVRIFSPLSCRMSA